MKLIVGQGLAGTLLALELRKHSEPYRVVDGGLGSSGSGVAAGILNPVTGKRLAKSWRWESFRASAVAAYREWESLLGLEIFQDTRVLRLFKDPDEHSTWERKRALPTYAGLFGQRFAPGEAGCGIQDAFGCFEILQAGILEVQEFLAASRNLFKDEGTYVEQPFLHGDLHADGITALWQGEKFSGVVFCEGFRVLDNPWFNWIPMEPAQGEIQTLRLVTDPPRGILNRGKWLRPNSDGTYQGGATHQWDCLEAGPTEASGAELKSGIQSIVDGPLHVLKRRTGVRPATKDRRPAIGFHPEHPCLSVLNGLGAKGSLMAPWLAQHLLSAVLDGQPIDPEVDVQRFLSRP